MEAFLSKVADLFLTIMFDWETVVDWFFEGKSNE